MTQYLLSVHHDGTEDFETMSQEEHAAGLQAGRRLQRRAAGVAAAGSSPAGSSRSTATVVDATGGEPVITDGPFAESKEYLGGFWIIEAADLDAALEIARRGSAACEGKVEVRPFQAE